MVIMQRTMKAALLSLLRPQCPPCSAQTRTHTFRQAWKLRRSEILVLAQRADCRCLASRKKLVLADTTLFADIKEPKSAIEDGEQVRELLMTFYTTRLRRSPPSHGVRTTWPSSVSPAGGTTSNARSPNYLPTL